MAAGAAKLKACADTPTVFDDDGSGGISGKGVAAPKLNAAVPTGAGAGSTELVLFNAGAAAA